MTDDCLYTRYIRAYTCEREEEKDMKLAPELVRALSNENHRFVRTLHVRRQSCVMDTRCGTVLLQPAEHPIDGPTDFDWTSYDPEVLARMDHLPSDESAEVRDGRILIRGERVEDCRLENQTLPKNCLNALPDRMNPTDAADLRAMLLTPEGVERDTRDVVILSTQPGLGLRVVSTESEPVRVQWMPVHWDPKSVRTFAPVRCTREQLYWATKVLRFFPRDGELGSDRYGCLYFRGKSETHECRVQIRGAWVIAAERLTSFVETFTLPSKAVVGARLRYPVSAYDGRDTRVTLGTALTTSLMRLSVSAAALARALALLDPTRPCRVVFRADPAENAPQAVRWTDPPNVDWILFPSSASADSMVHTVTLEQGRRYLVLSAEPSAGYCDWNLGEEDVE